MKNIYFVGSSCVGKTSVLGLLSEDPRFENYKIQKSISRQLIENHKILGSFNSIGDQQVLTDAYHESMLSNTSDTIFDRSLLDVCTFTQTIKDDSFDFVEEMTRELDLLDSVKDQYKEGVVFYFPILWNAENDSVRLIDENRRSLWDSYIKNFLKREGINFFTMRDEDPKSRVDFIFNTLKNLCD